MLDRRRFLTLCTAAGLTTSLADALWAQTGGEGPITRQVLTEAEKVAGLSFTDAERDLALAGLADQLEAYRKLRGIELPNSVVPALRFSPLLPGQEPPRGESTFSLARATPPRRPGGDDELAFMPLTALARLLAAREVSSAELTRLYLDRLERFDPALHCVISRTEKRALAEAERADREIAAGQLRGPLHGIPWGAKDLLAARGYRTTWGAKPYEEQAFEEDATVVRRLTEAGAVLVAKLSLGALAWGDVWFGGKTRNPWKPEQGSSGSSAGSAAATAAGLVGFAIGSETWGSIVSPATRCGATGLRPTFGRVSRHGAMALSWSMDKLGPICRSVEDCAAVFAAIHGPDGHDPSVVEAPFSWQGDLDVRKLRVGYVRSLFEGEITAPEGATEEERAELARAREVRAFDLAALDVLRDLGLELIPVELPNFPAEALSFILSAEAAAAFDELTRGGRDDLLVRQEERAWPNVFRQARMIPAVEYIQANRARTLLMARMEEMMAHLDAFVAPSFGGDSLLITNLTGHPAVVMPHGFRTDGTPTSITFTGRLFEEGHLLALARAWQEATDFHLRHPELSEDPTEDRSEAPEVEA